MTGLVSKIKSRGHWLVILHPTTFNERLFPDISALQDVVRGASVKIRGWDFPHISRDGPTIGVDWIEDSTDWSDHVEHWRLYQSGQFVHQSGIRTDWRDQSHSYTVHDTWQPGSELAVEDTLYRFVEVFEFVARLAAGPMGVPSLALQIALVGLNNRALHLSPARMGFSLPPTARIDEFPQHLTLSREEAVAGARANAFSAARELFKRFGWVPDDRVFESMVEELRRAGFTV